MNGTLKLLHQHDAIKLVRSVGIHGIGGGDGKNPISAQDVGGNWNPLNEVRAHKRIICCARKSAAPVKHKICSSRQAQTGNDRVRSDH